ncbi:PREDICTED: KN motif and ankyrin repeat domain-containing protein 1-like, partial [Amphimedon queenslandica]
MIDDRPDISLLIEWLEPLIPWKRFGLCLVGMKEHEISKIEHENSLTEERKLALYSKWLSFNPNATWRDVIDALTSIKENALAQDIEKHIETSDSDGGIEIILFPKEDKKVQDSLNELQTKFSHIMRKVKSIFRKRIIENSQLFVEISEWVEDQLHWKPDTIDNDLRDVFKKIYHYYDFSDCNLIVNMCNEFISDEKDLLDELKAYSVKADEFRSSEPITELEREICNVYGPYRKQLENMPLICIKLQNHWNKVKIRGLRILIESLLPEELRQSVMKCITIEKGCVIIKLHILNSTADSLIQYNRRNLEFICLIGIYSLHISNHPVLEEDENINFTFELALLQAAIVGNNEAVEFLLKLETVNINHNDKGETALMLASKGGHEDIVHSLLSAGTNVDIQDNKGWTALMITSEHNHISIIEKLMQANANPHLKTSDGLNALMIASYHGNYEVVRLLISQGVDYNCQAKDGANALMVACQNGHTQIVEL